MSSQTDILASEFELLKEELITKHRELGMRASGNWEESLSVEISSDENNIKASITGESYSQQLESGRSPGKQPPSKAIEAWIYEKGIASNIEGNISISSLAFLIARKIAHEGWKREEYGGVELISQVVTPERIQKIIDKVSDIYVSDFSNEIVNFLKQAA